MKVAIFAAIAAVIIIIILSLCKAGKKGDEKLEHPERLILKGDK